MLEIVGTITATTPIHQTDPNREGNISRTVKTYAWGRDQVRRSIPFITGNSVRGLLRRRAADIVLGSLNSKVPRELFSVLTSGKASRKAVGMQAPVKAMTEGGANVFAGLFGGGGYMLESRYSMSPLFPMVEWCADWMHHSLHDRLIPSARLTHTRQDGTVFDAPLVEEIILTSKDDVMMGRGAENIENYLEAYESWTGQSIAGRVAKASAKAEKNAAKQRGEKPVKGAKEDAISVDIAGFNLIEAMLPGTPLQFWLRFRPRASQAQIGLMLMAVRDWANENTLGGASSRGFGRFNANLALYDGDKVVAPSLFNLSDHATSYELVSDLGTYVKAANAALKVNSVAEMEAVYATKVKASGANGDE